MTLPYYTQQAAYGLCEQITSGEHTESEIIHILEAISNRGESIDEIVGFAKYLRENCVKIPTQGINTMDVCGTGGSQLPRMNTSTVVAFALAASGIPVAKHGNKAVSGRSGSFDVLEALHIPIEQSAECISKTLSEFNLGFVFAPKYHPLLKQVSAARKTFGRRSIFNLLGPLINPTQPKFQLLGTTTVQTARLLAHSLKELGIERAIVVCGSDGLDDITLTGPSTYLIVTQDKITEHVFNPCDYGFSIVESFESLRGGTPQENSITMVSLLNNDGPTPLKNLAIINTAFGFFAHGSAKTIESGIAQSRAIFKSKKPNELLNKYIPLAQKYNS